MARRKFLFKIGDKVRVVKYGHLLWSNDDDELPNFIGTDPSGNKAYDISPELVGKIGIITERDFSQSQCSYSLYGIKGKTAWYDEEQLVLIRQRNKKAPAIPDKG